MNRKELIDILELVKPALADDNIVPVFTNFCFDDGVVYGYRDSLAILAPVDVEGRFAVNGKVFFELVKQAQAKELEFTLNKNELLFNAGKSKMKMPYLEGDEFMFEEPEVEDWKVMFDLDHTFIEGLDLCLVTTANDSTMPGFMGVTLRDGDRVALYSCDSDSMSRYYLNPSKGNGEQYTMPNEFCEALIRIAEKTGFVSGQFYINDEWAMADFGNNFRVWGRIIHTEEVFDFEENLSAKLKRMPTFVNIPDSLLPALNRARVVADIESKGTTLRANGNKVILETHTHFGDVKDTVTLDEEHKSVVAYVSAKLISRVVAISSEFAMTDAFTIYRDSDDFLVLVGNLGE